MTTFDRRRFVQTILLGVMNSGASATPLCQETSNHASGTPQTANVVLLERGEQQLRFSPPDPRFGFQSFVRAGGNWKPATLPGIPLVTGPTFSFIASRVHRDGPTVSCEGTGKAAGLNGEPVKYGWRSEISAHTTTPWFRFRTVLQIPTLIRLRQEVQVEPQIIV